MPADPLSLFVLAGEASGDRIGASLVEALRRRASVRLSGVGGEEMAAQGLNSLFPISDLSVMGFADVARRLPRLYFRLAQAARHILREQPDIVVLVDAQVFSAALARRLRARGYRGRIVLYVAPAVWAWKPERAPALKGSFDEILAVLPFEPDVFARLGGPSTHYVGHPALERFPMREAQPGAGPLLLLPGSRDGEIRRTIDMMRSVAGQLAGHPRVTSFVLPTPAGRHSAMLDLTRNWGVPVDVVSSDADRHRAFAAAVGAVAVTGTVTLELALAGVPMATTYVADAGQVKRFFKYEVKFVSLPNIILDRPVVPELLLARPDPEGLLRTVTTVLDNAGVAEGQIAAFRELRALMESGAPGAPVVDAADRVLAMAGRIQSASA